MAFRSFEDLEVWKRACQLAVVVCRKLEGWQDLWFREQIGSAAVSIASNIAEGSERGGKDFLRFLRIASGSAAELRTQIYIAEGIGKLPPDEATAIVNETKEIAKMITGLSKSIKRKLHHPPPPNIPPKDQPPPPADTPAPHTDHRPPTTDHRPLNTEH